MEEINISQLIHELNTTSVILRLLLSTIIGGVVGIDRGRHGHAAGLRTHILVSLGATMTAMMGLYCTDVLGYVSDPLRVGAQVISGIGFLGAGTILLRSKTHVMGLTTAAGLWTTAILGLAIGVGFYFGVIVTFFIMIITISVLSHLEHKRRYKGTEVYYLEVNDVNAIGDLGELAEAGNMFIQINSARSNIDLHVGVEVNVVERSKLSDETLELMKAREYVVFMIPVQVG